jgi:acyl-CoA reductase-like NAD-dependent aldehyde dehydrogenase
MSEGMPKPGDAAVPHAAENLLVRGFTLMVMVLVNLPTAGIDYRVPFGGSRKSSYGPREQRSVAIEFYTQIKTAYTWA